MAEPNKKRRRAPLVTSADCEALQAVYALSANAVHRIDAAARAGMICELLAGAHIKRVVRAIRLAVRGQMPPAQAALEIAQSEYEASRKAPLHAHDEATRPAVREAVRQKPVQQPPCPPQPLRRLHLPTPNPAWHMKEQGDEYDQAMEEYLAMVPDGPFEDDEPDDRNAA
ncbi:MULTISPECIES: hypothetical protein [Methylobacteriaceae]|uniref:Uncharacterized protein n=2 Tax=Methylorubrum TaxID=2282523 RepID=A0AA40VDD1_9HYPH|nr:hypothetical protein [Methylorubrum thiocyanatum]AWI88457.1 hypothetical protein C0214_09475 [Methylobacterium sp. DM1]MBA8915060.1 hypothetical protein [Methylorubrum thiocyanatum]GJE79466.1 hypothetical protein CJNNKLLH_0792 [Methylorubrum thiocyanatum]